MPRPYLPSAYAARLVGLLVMLALPGSASAQRDTLRRSRQYQAYRHTRLTLLAGGQLQQSGPDTTSRMRAGFELGLHCTIIVQPPLHMAGTLTQGPSVEIYPGKSPLAGFKYSAWMQASLLAAGLSTVYYTDFHAGSLKLRPELGLGFPNFKFVLGYNIPTVRHERLEAAANARLQFSLNILLKLKTLKRA